ncbi:hypothetical protein GOV04_06015 [Candidatus Woesearchaeota archaeon]|nr:hypothetical protein [Candidatus Woesearchaeota archaeon]
MKKQLIITIILVIALLVGCSPSNTGPEPNTNFRSGSQGLTMSFLEGNPPSRIYSGDPLNIVVELHNIGAYPDQDSNIAFDGRLYIGGYDASYITRFSPKTIPADLNGKSQYDSQGGFAVVEFKDNSVSIPSDIPSYQAPIKITACYKYQTILTTEVCVDPDPYTTVRKNKVCQGGDIISVSGSQGAPLAVTNIEQEVTSDRIKYRITIQNVGDGQVIDYDELHSRCPNNLDYQTMNIVELQAKQANTLLGNCKPTLPVRLIDGRGTVVCEISKPPQNIEAYITPLSVQLDYGYTDYISTSVEILSAD